MNFGAHAPYIFSAYAVSIIAVAGLIIWRVVALKSAAKAELKEAAERH